MNRPMEKLEKFRVKR